MRRASGKLAQRENDNETLAESRYRACASQTQAKMRTRSTETKQLTPPSLARAKPCHEQSIDKIPKLSSVLTPKRAERVRIEMSYGMSRVPLCMLMILHATFAFGTDVNMARETFREYARKELREVFAGYAWVLDVLKASHYHLG
jgi:hypothetical protein